MMRLASYFVLSLFVAVGVLCQSVAGVNTGGTAIQLTIEDAIGPATHDYIERSLDAAAESRASMVVIRMDTPGGLDKSMRSIIKNISNSPVPVVTYVAPTGARAASAGTYILYASHIAAMAPGTNIGAATPVSIGGISPPGTTDNKDKSAKPAEENNNGDIPGPGDTMKRKIINDAVAYIRGLAKLHDRNQEWAEKAVREAASLPASEALELNVIDIVATDTGDLLKQIDGREVTVLGNKQTLETAGLVLEKRGPDWRSRLLSVITNPNIAYILMLVGIYGLIFEFTNPGAIVPGVVGGIALIIALYAFQLLPINYAGMGLIVLGIVLMVGEAFQPSFGVLGIGGLVAFVIGSIILIDTDVPAYGIDISVIATFAIASLLMFIVIVGMAFRARRRPVVSGLEELVGGIATVVNDFNQKGRVHIHSETWSALSDTPLSKGQKVRVTGIKGLTLHVEPLKTSIEEHKS